MKKYYILLLALLLVSVTIYFLTQPGKVREQSQTLPPPTEVEPDVETDRTTGTADIPDMKAGDDALAVGERLDLDSVSPTILTHEEILEDVTAVLEGLRLLDPAAVQRISPLTATGEYNPTHYMLAAALENPALHGAFRKLGLASAFEVVALIPSESNPNSFTAQIRCHTPYAVHAVQQQFASTQPLSAQQEYAAFAGSGAAQWVSEQPDGSFDMTSDVVSIGVLVIDDVPTLFHPVSEIYGSRIPQYAFLWGGFLFQGIENNDLLLENRLGSLTPWGAELVAATGRGPLLTDYLETAMDLLRVGDFDTMRGLELGGAAFADSWFLTRTYPAYREAMEKDAGFEEEIQRRLASLDCRVAVYGSEEDSSQSVIAVTVTVEDTPAGGTVQSVFYQSVDLRDRQGFTAFEGNLINSYLTEMMETAMGGSHTGLQARLQSRGPA